MDLALYNKILRLPSDVANDCRDDRGTASLAAHALAAIFGGSLLFGAAVGSWNGGAQIAFAALKLPLATLATLVLFVPAFYAVAAVFGRPWTLRTVVSLSLSAGARSSLVLLAASPVLWLTISLGATYHLTKLVAALCYALAGLSALTLLARGVGPGPGRTATVTLLVGVYLLVGGQTAWILRPYLGLPDGSPIPLFTRAREGGVLHQLWTSLEHLADRTGEREQP